MATGSATSALNVIKDFIRKWNAEGTTAEVTGHEIAHAFHDHETLSASNRREQSAELARLTNSLFAYDAKADRAFFTPGRSA